MSCDAADVDFVVTGTRPLAPPPTFPLPTARKVTRGESRNVLRAGVGYVACLNLLVGVHNTRFQHGSGIWKVRTGGALVTAQEQRRGGRGLLFAGNVLRELAVYEKRQLESRSRTRVAGEAEGS